MATSTSTTTSSTTSSSTTTTLATADTPQIEVSNPNNLPELDVVVLLPTLITQENPPDFVVNDQEVTFDLREG